MKEIEKLQAGEEENEEVQDCLIDDSLDEVDRNRLRSKRKGKKSKTRAK